MADKTSHNVEKLADVALDAIRSIKPDLDPANMMLLGPDAVEPMLECWNKLERGVCAAKLAIIRDEFMVRFPKLEAATESFSFGIIDKLANRYQILLEPREPDDVMNVAFEVVKDAFGERSFPGCSHFASNLAQSLQLYSRAIELKFAPFADEFGISGKS